MFIWWATASRWNAWWLSWADSSCQGRADSASLGWTYKAWLSSSTVSASSRLTHSSVPYVDIHGTIIANDWTDLTDWSIDNLLTYWADGQVLTERTYLTNTDVDGSIISTDLAYTCQDWTSQSSSYKYYYWRNDVTNWDWTNYSYSGQDCGWVVRLLCIEQ